MNWDKVQKAADKHGYLIYAMDQAQTPVMTQPGPWGAAASGYCAGLAVRWIGLRYVGADYKFNKATKVVEMPDWQSTRDQNLYENDLAAASGAGATFPEPYKPTFAKYGLTINSGLVTMMNVAATGGILRNAAAAKEGCYLISLRGPGGGHAVAMQNMGKSGWRFFDANYGAMKTNTPQGFENLMTWFLKATGYGTQYTTAVRIAGINPPPYVGANFQTLMKSILKKLGL
jgi:hypothetical protein